VNAPVAVQAVLAEYIRAHDMPEDLVMAALAVSELIQADRDYDAAIAALSDLNRRIAERGWIEVEHDALRKAGKSVVRAQARRRSALARVGSAS
jgi:hypothetical protein